MRAFSSLSISAHASREKITIEFAIEMLNPFHMALLYLTNNYVRHFSIHSTHVHARNANTITIATVIAIVNAIAILIVIVHSLPFAHP